MVIYHTNLCAHARVFTRARAFLINILKYIDTKRHPCRFYNELTCHNDISNSLSSLAPLSVSKKG